MDFLLNNTELSFTSIIWTVLIAIFLMMIVAVSFSVTTKFVDAEFAKLKGKLNTKMEKVIVIISSLVFSLGITCISAILVGEISAYFKINPHSIHLAYLPLLLIFTAILTTIHVISSPNHQHAKILSLTATESSMLLFKFKRIVFVTGLAMILVFINAHVGENDQNNLYQYLFNGVLAIYYFFEIMLYKWQISKAFDIQSKNCQFAALKLANFISDKFYFLAAISMIAIIVSNCKVNLDNAFFKSIESIWIFLCAMFVMQLAITGSVRKVMDYIQYIQKCKNIKSLQARINNVVFISNFVIITSYLLCFGIVMHKIGVDAVLSIFTGKIVSIALISFISIIVHKIFIEYKEVMLEKYQNTDEKQYQKIITFVPVMHATICTILAIFSSMLILVNFGINITPIVAAFSVLGAGIGFAASDIIKSFLQGIIFLIEKDLFVGEYVAVGNGLTGIIEKLSVRVMVLRSPEGVLHVIPYSAVSTISNYSKDFSFQFSDLCIESKQDVDNVIQAINKVSTDMRNDSVYSSILLGDVEVYGIKPFDFDGIKISIGIKTTPDPYKIANLEFFKRLHNEFRIKNIAIPMNEEKLFNYSLTSE